MGERRFDLNYIGMIWIMFFLILVHVEKADYAKYLGCQQRFNDSTIYDSYYCCNLCSSSLSWVVNREVPIMHFEALSSVGSVQSYRDNDAAIVYHSVILSHRNKSGETCMDALLIISQIIPEWKPSVICRGTLHERHVSYDNFTTANIYLPKEVHNNSVRAKPSLVQQDVVSPGNSFFTGVIVCQSNDGTVSWEGNGKFIVSFAAPGLFDCEPHPLEPNVALWETIVLEKNGSDITSVIVGTDFSPDNLGISCHSMRYEASFAIRSDAIENEMTTILEDTKRMSPTTVAYAGSKQVTSYYITILVWMGLAMIFQQNIIFVVEPPHFPNHT